VLSLPSRAFDTPSLVSGPNIGQLPDIGQLPGQPAELDGLPIRGSLLLMESLKQFNDALPGYLLARDFYEGTAGDLFATEKVSRLLANSGVYDVEEFNYARVPVREIAKKLGIRAVVCGAGDDSDEDDSVGEKDDTLGTEDSAPTGEAEKKKLADKADEMLDELRKRNQLVPEEKQLMLKTSEYGDCYLFVWPVVQATEEEAEEAFEEGMEVDETHTGRVVSVDIFVNDPTSARIFYDPENQLHATHAIKVFEWIDPEQPEADLPCLRATLYFKEYVERWVTPPGSDGGRREDWKPYTPPGVTEWPAENPTGRLPFFHFRTDRTYGTPEHAPAFGPQRLINKLIAAHAVTIDYQSFPQRYALSNPKMDDVLNNLLDPDFPEDDDDDPQGSGMSQLRADPSAVWKLPGISSVGQFQPADPRVFLDPLDRYIGSMAELCEIPRYRFTQTAQIPSGESLREENKPLDDKAVERQAEYGSVLGAAYEFALELLGMKDITVTVQWKPTTSASSSDDWGIIEKKIANGVPVQQVLIEAGYAADQVEKWLLDESGADLVRRVALLNSIGTAIQAMAAGAAVGMVSPEQAGAIFAKVLGVVGEDLPALEVPVELHPQMAQQALELQNQQRGAQVAEHIASAPPDRPDKPPVERPLPPAPPPPPPVRVGDK
jgi:hypothetical protein